VANTIYLGCSICCIFKSFRPRLRGWCFNWTDATISIAGFKEDTIRFGTTEDGLTAGQLSTIGGAIYSLKPDGFMSIPEPSGYGLLLGATGLAIVLVRRRL